MERGRVCLRVIEREGEGERWGWWAQREGKRVWGDFYWNHLPSMCYWFRERTPIGSIPTTAPARHPRVTSAERVVSKWEDVWDMRDWESAREKEGEDEVNERGRVVKAGFINLKSLERKLIIGIPPRLHLLFSFFFFFISFVLDLFLYLLFYLFISLFIFYQTGDLLVRHVHTLHYNCRQLGAVQAGWTWMCRCQLNPCRLEDLIIHGNHALSPQWMHSAQPRWMLCPPLPPQPPLFLPLSFGGFIRLLQVLFLIRNIICCCSRRSLHDRLRGAFQTVSEMMCVVELESF